MYNGSLPLDVAPQSCIYMDGGYTDYRSEEDLFAAEMIHARVQRKKNSKGKDQPYERFLKEHMRWRNRNEFQPDKSKNAP
ncbi:MAG: hypothetical protein ICV81_05045 [Flavisolibacter sp.]|nr:hypothetical protein [Flavisolibacter sp.]